jgi:hypothetical protein
MRVAMPSSSGMAEAALSPRAVVESIDFDQFGADDRGKNQLRDAIAAPDDQRLGAKVDHDDADFAAIVGVDGAGRINQGQPFTQRAPAARPHLPLESGWYFKRDSGRDRGTLQRLQLSLAVNIGHQVKPRGVIALIAWKWQLVPAKTLNLDPWHCHLTRGDGVPITRDAHHPTSIVKSNPIQWRNWPAIMSSAMQSNPSFATFWR